MSISRSWTTLANQFDNLATREIGRIKSRIGEPVSDLSAPKPENAVVAMPLLVNFDQLFSFGVRTLKPSALPQQPATRFFALKARRMILIKNGLWNADNSQATNLSDEKPCWTRTDLARQVAEEYVSDLREIINQLRKKLN